MSGVLQRLVARAAGTEKPGLQARLPARFEAGGIMEDGFSERVEEVTVEPRNAQEEVPVAPAREAFATENVTGEVRADPQKARFLPDLTPRKAQTHKTETVPEDRQNDEPPIAEALHDVDGPSAPPTPLLASVELVAERAVTEERLATDAAPASVSQVGDAPPEPLLSTDPVEREVEALPVTPKPAAKRVERGVPTVEPVDTQPPEISIHIGRIEVRGETEKAAPRKRAPRELKLSSLSDFLGGGAS